MIEFLGGTRGSVGPFLEKLVLSPILFSELPPEEPAIPAACVSDSHRSCHYLTDNERLSVARILTCFAYNSPDIRFCPMLYPIAAILRHYLSGKCS